MVISKKLFACLLCSSTVVFILVIEQFLRTKVNVILLNHTGRYEKIKEEEISFSTNLHKTKTQKQRQTLLRKYCQHLQATQPQRQEGVNSYNYGNGFFYSPKQKVIYCRVGKVACTTWKRVLLLFEGKQKTLMEIPKYEVHNYKLKQLKHLNRQVSDVIRQRYYSFMFTRHPHDRLFSAYRNKFFDPRNKTFYLEKYGPYMVFGDSMTKSEIDHFVKKNKIDKSKLKVSFEQFVRFILKTQPDLDEHWEPHTSICKVCHFKFNYLGKFETINKDAKNILKALNQHKVYEMFGDDTVYTEKTSFILKKYYAELPKELLKLIYQRYKGDFEAFGYDPFLYVQK